MPLPEAMSAAPSRATITEILSLQGPMTGLELSHWLNGREKAVRAVLGAMVRDRSVRWAGTFRGGEGVFELTPAPPAPLTGADLASADLDGGAA